MEFNYVAMKFWWEALITLMIGANVVYTWAANRHKASAAAIERVDSRVSDLHQRVNTLEADVRHMPTHDDMGNLHEKINDVANGVGMLRGELGAINRTLGMINEHLIREAQK